jgi:shikimate dehydrogenase
MMNAAFRAAGMAARYDAVEVTREHWAKELPRWFEDGVAGLNVTVPLKEVALASVVVASETAREIGAANVLARGGAGWEADNTDGPGFLQWVRRIGGAALLDREALVLGAGGSARAVAWALLGGGCPKVRVANRTRERAEALAEESGDPGRIAVETAGRAAPAGGLVVNCTSLGLREGDPLPLAPEVLRGAELALDLVYPETQWVAAARREGVAAETGLGLLVEQAVLSFERWTGVAPDRAVMLEAAEAEIVRRTG